MRKAAVKESNAGPIDVSYTLSGSPGSYDLVLSVILLGIFGMGHAEKIDVTPGMTLDNAYSGNVVDICPVGALTSSDFRFKVRAWFLQRTASVCAGCSTGCG